MLACVREFKRLKSDKYISICSVNQASLKAPQAAKTSPLVYQCQRALNDISTHHSARSIWNPEHPGLP
jgi:hypothetical protein